MSSDGWRLGSCGGASVECRVEGEGKGCMQFVEEHRRKCAVVVGEHALIESAYLDGEGVSGALAM